LISSSITDNAKNAFVLNKSPQKENFVKMSNIAVKPQKMLNDASKTQKML